jgi:hypothetical protein
VSQRLTETLTELLQRDNRTVPGKLDRTMLFTLIWSWPWLRFAVGVNPDEPMPTDDDDGLYQSAVEFLANYKYWVAYRDSTFEIEAPTGKHKLTMSATLPPGTPKPSKLPAVSFCILSAWNPGPGEPRPSAAANRRANERLGAHLDARGVERWPTMIVPALPQWREEAFCVRGLDEMEAWRIGEAFQQRAVFYVAGSTGLLISRRRNRVVRWESQVRLAQ